MIIHDLFDISGVRIIDKGINLVHIKGQER